MRSYQSETRVSQHNLSSDLLQRRVYPQRVDCRKNAPSTQTLRHADHDHRDLLEWQTWGGGGLGDPLTRPAESVALEVKRKLVTVEGAKANYGVIINPSTLELDGTATEILRADIEKAEAGQEAPLYDRGGSISELVARCKEETGFDPPVPQWEDESIYGPHCNMKYVQDWYKKGREMGYKIWDV